jgi:hypothetical protein
VRLNNRGATKMIRTRNVNPQMWKARALNRGLPGTYHMLSMCDRVHPIRYRLYPLCRRLSNKRRQMVTHNSVFLWLSSRYPQCAWIVKPSYVGREAQS